MICRAPSLNCLLTPSTPDFCVMERLTVSWGQHSLPRLGTFACAVSPSLGHSFTPSLPEKFLLTLVSEWVKIYRLCLTLCNLMDYSLPGSFAHGILQTKQQFPRWGWWQSPPWYVVEQYHSKLYNGLPWCFSGKEPYCQCRRPGFHPWVGKIS